MAVDTASRSEPSDFKLGDWWVRPQRNELERSDETVQVEARSMSVLVCLARHAPAVVGKERLVEEVWSDSPHIGDDAISHAIWELRKALGDSAREPVYIQTVSRRGYCIVAEILRPQGAPLPLAGARIDHYELVRELGRGAMGVVYEAIDHKLGRPVAIKFVAPELTRDPQACGRFEREARLAATVDHPNLATVFEVGETSGGYRYLVCAYYGGGSLKDRLEAGPIPQAEAVEWMRQLLAGLGAAHRRGIIHRDIKPANLLLDEHGILKICDFGIAKLMGGTDLTKTGASLGTPAYKSPEQAQGQEIDHRTDLWSAGVVFFELLTGRRPFAGEHEQAVLRSILALGVQGLEDAAGVPLPEPLCRFVGRVLEKDPTRRFQSSDEALEALDQLGRVEDTSRWRWSGHRLAWGTGCMLVLALGSVATYRQTASRPQEELVVSSELQEAEIHLEQGRRIWLRGNYPANLAEVRDHFERAVKLAPQSAEAHGHLAAFLVDYAAIAEQLELLDDAYREIQKTRSWDPKSPLADAAEAWLLVLRGQPEVAEKLARNAIARETTCPRDESCDLAYLWRGDALWALDRRDDALNVLEEGAQVGGGYIRCRLKRAQLFEEMGQSLEAETEYRRVLAADGDQITALGGLANFYLESGRTNEAVPYLNRLTRVVGDARSWVNLAYAFYTLHLWDDTAKAYQKAISLDEAAGSKTPTAYMGLGDVYLEQAEPERARRAFEEALDVFDANLKPNKARKAQRAVCLAKLGRFEDAKLAISELLSEEADATPDMLRYAAQIAALERDQSTLFDLARRWAGKGKPSAGFLEDPAFIPYREDRRYLQILQPELFPLGLAEESAPASR